MAQNTEDKFGAKAAAMNTFDSDGKAFDGNYVAVGIAFGLIGLGALAAVGYAVSAALSAAF